LIVHGRSTEMGRRHSRYLLDASVSAGLKDSFPRDAVITSVEGGLTARADDKDVINLALERRSLLVTADQGFLQKCKNYQKQRGNCLFGLLILPQGIQFQEGILEDVERQRKKLLHPQIDRSVTWADVRDENLVVIAHLEGNPTVMDLCDCPWID
jgi:hypothetical protein